MTDQDLVEVLAARDVPCPHCRYNLRAISRAWCPECGTALSLTVVPRTGFPTVWLIAVIASGIIASHLPDSIRFFTWAAIYGLDRWWWDRSMVIHYGSIGFLIAMIALVVNRNRFVRLGSWHQWSLAGVFLLFACLHLMIRWRWIEWG